MGKKKKIKAALNKARAKASVVAIVAVIASREILNMIKPNVPTQKN